MGIPGVRRISVRRGFYFKEVAMSRLIQGSSIVRTGAMVVSALLLFTGASALAGTTHRSIMDFINAQGQVSFGPPGTQQVAGVPDFVGFTDTKRNLAISADYAGLADKALLGVF